MLFRTKRNSGRNHSIYWSVQ